jgi:integrase
MGWVVGIDSPIRDLSLHLGKEYPSRARANRLYAVARKMLKWAHSIDRIPHDPTVNVSQPGKKPKARERVLTDDEIKALWKAVEGDQVHFATRGAVQLLILTGLRPTEVFRLQWSWVGDDSITIPSGETKMNQKHIVPRTPMVNELLESMADHGQGKWLFPSSTDRTKKLDPTTCSQLVYRKLDVDYKLHDLRRAVASWLVQHGVSMDTARCILGHRPQGVLGEVYLSDAAQVPHVKAALEKWQDHVTVLISE